MNKGRFLPRRRKNNPVIREYERAVEHGRWLLENSYHVIPKGNRWAVKQNNSRDCQVFGTQGEAIDAAKRTAKDRGTELFIHGRDGRIRERNSYGADPFPPRG